MASTIYLLRHGQTQFNAERRLQGHCNSALTAEGEQQAQAMGATLREQLGEASDYAMWVSPLGRAQQTAQLVAQQLNLSSSQIKTDPRLIEVSFGEWEKRPVLDVFATFPHLEQRGDWHFAAPGGESLDAVVARIKEVLADPQLPPKLIIVAHGLLGRIFRGVYANLQDETMWAQDMPQDAFFRLHAGSISRIECLQIA